MIIEVNTVFTTGFYQIYSNIAGFDCIKIKKPPLGRAVLNI
jgi:hypothetical protein